MLHKHYFKKSSMTICAVITATMISGMSVSAMLAPSDRLPDEFPAFTSTDLNGNEITEDLFSEKDVTMINIWGTFCPSCISGMPGLAEISEAMPENQQMIGIISDVWDVDDPNYALAQQIAEKSGASYTHIIATEDMSDLFTAVDGIPYTLFVDKDGVILGKPILGANEAEYKNRLAQYEEEFPADAADGKSAADADDAEASDA